MNTVTSTTRRWKHKQRCPTRFTRKDESASETSQNFLASPGNKSSKAAGREMGNKGRTAKRRTTQVPKELGGGTVEINSEISNNSEEARVALETQLKRAIDMMGDIEMGDWLLLIVLHRMSSTQNERRRRDAAEKCRYRITRSKALFIYSASSAYTTR